MGVYGREVARCRHRSEPVRELDPKNNTSATPRFWQAVTFLAWPLCFFTFEADRIHFLSLLMATSMTQSL